MTKLSIFFLSCSVLYVVYFWSSGDVLHIFVLIFKIMLIRLNAQIREGMALNEEILFIIYLYLVLFVARRLLASAE